MFRKTGIRTADRLLFEGRRLNHRLGGPVGGGMPYLHT